MPYLDEHRAEADPDPTRMRASWNPTSATAVDLSATAGLMGTVVTFALANSSLVFVSASRRP